MKIPGLDFFEIEELVHPDIFETFGERSIHFLDPAMLRTIVAIRKKFGPIVINDWMWGGNFKFSGLRPMDSTVGAKYSMHKYGKAADCKSEKYTPAEMQEFILANPHCFPDLRRMENVSHTPTWLHIDTANTTDSGIVLFKP